MVDVGHLGDAVGHERGDHEGSPSADVRRPDGGGGEARDAPDHGVMSLRADVRSHPLELTDVREPALEDVLRRDARPVRDGEHRQEDRLEIGGDPRIRERDEVEGAWLSMLADTQPLAARPGYLRARVLQLREEQVQVLGPRVLDRDVALRRDGRGRPRPRFDPIGNGIVAGRTKLAHAVDRDRAAAGALHPGAHRHEEVGQIGDLGLPCRVVDHGGAARQHPGEQEVLGGRDARVVERDRCAVQRRRLGHQEAMLGSHGRPHPLQPADVQLDRPGPDLVSARERDASAPGPGQQRPEDDDRRADLPHEVVGRLETGYLGRVEDRGVRTKLDRHAEMGQQLRHDGTVADPRHVADHAPPGRQECGGHQLERRVLRAGDPYGSLETPATRDEETIHRSMVDRRAGPGP